MCWARRCAVSDRLPSWPAVWLEARRSNRDPIAAFISAGLLDPADAPAEPAPPPVRRERLRRDPAQPVPSRARERREAEEDAPEPRALGELPGLPFGIDVGEQQQGHDGDELSGRPLPTAGPAIASSTRTSSTGSGP